MFKTRKRFFTILLSVVIIAFGFLIITVKAAGNYSATVEDVNLGIATVGYNNDEYVNKAYVTNTGDENLYITEAYSRIVLTDGDTDKFIVGWNTGGGSIAPDEETDKGYIKPITGLAVGTYEAEYAYQYAAEEDDWHTLAVGIVYFEVTDDLVHQVIFESNGGDRLPRQYVDDGENVPNPPAIYKEGYVFDGWYSDVSLNAEFDFDTPITENITIFAKWNEIIEDAKATITAPAANQNPDMTPVAVDSEKYSVSFTTWYPDAEPSNSLTASSTFVAGNSYTLRVVFEPNEGYTFTNDTVFEINDTLTSSYGDVRFRQVSFVVPDAGEPDPEPVVTHILFNGVGGTYSYNFETDNAEELANQNIAKTTSSMFSVPAGNTLTVVATPINGYSFVGWFRGNVDAQDISEYATNELISSNSTYSFVPEGYPYLAPVFEEVNIVESVTVTFNSNEGSAVPSRTIASGSTVSRPQNPTKENYTFGGWYSDVSLNAEFDFDTPITSDITLFAKWIDNDMLITQINVTVAPPEVGTEITLDPQEGQSPLPTVTVPDNVNYYIDSAYWNKGTYPIVGDEYEDEFVGTIAENTYYYVMIDACSDIDNGYYLADANNLTITVNGESPAEVFGVYFHEGTRFIARIASVNPIVEYTLTYDVNGGTPIDSVTRLAGSRITLPEPVKNLHNFVEWQVWDDEQNPVGAFHAGDEFIFTEDITLHAAWETITINTHTTLKKTGDQVEEVAYDTNLATYISNKKQEWLNSLTEDPDYKEEWASLYVNEGGVYKYPLYVRTVFTGITASNDVILVGDINDLNNISLGNTVTYNYDVEYIEVTVEKEKVAVTFNSNGGSNVANVTIEKGTPVTEPQDPTRNGYEFVGWSKDEAIYNPADGTVAVGKDLFDFSVNIMENTTLVANWIKLYKVKFDTGDVLPDEYKLVDQEVLAGDTPTIPVDSNGDRLIDEYNAYESDGFYTDKDCTIPYMGEPIYADTTIYVKWYDLTEEYDEHIMEVDLTINPPKVGTEITMEDEYDPDTQSPELTVSVPEDAPYQLWAETDDENYAYWLTEKSFNCDEYFTGILVKKHKYYAKIWLLSNDRDVAFVRNAVIKVNGTAINVKDYLNDLDNLQILVEITPEEEVYNIISGANTTMDIDKIKDITVKADGPISKFEGIMVDDKVVDPEYYDAIEGSTIVTLKTAFLKTLKAGVHTLTIMYTDGDVTTNFIINEVEPVEVATAATTNSDVPQTLDIINMWITLLVLSSVGFALDIVVLKKYN